MKITELYIYPIKSLRPCSVPRMRLGHEGPEHDRRFMLLRVDDADAGRYTNVQVFSFPECARFEQEIDGNDVVVTYRTPKGQDEEEGELEEAEEAEDGKMKKMKKRILPHRVVLSPEEQQRPALRVPLKPSARDLRETVEVKLFGSTATAYRMGEEPYDSWFSARLGYRVMLVYIGDSRRDVLAHSPNNANRRNNVSSSNDVTPEKQGWLSYLASYVYDNSSSAVTKPRDRDTLTFNEAAPFLVTSRASLRDVSSRLPPGEEMDMIAFRPNIVVGDDANGDTHDDGNGNADEDYDSGYDGSSSDDGSGQHGHGSNSTSLKPWEEDYWAELLVGSGSESGGGRSDGPRLALTANCARCVSINIDYETGRPAEGERGSVLKKLMGDRRVDAGNKWSPIFGRYAFLLVTPPPPPPGASASAEQQGDDEDEDVVAEAEEKAARAAADIAVGDEVRVTRRVSDRDVWSWPKT